jgi:hypothetical protein
MVHVILVPAFAVHDAASYYSAFISGISNTHTIQILSVDGYTQGGHRSLGDISLKQVVEECVQACNNEARRYALVGHSTGARIVGHMYTHLITKPLSVLLFNPSMRPPRIWLCQYIPLFVVLMRLLDLVPIPLITHVYTGKQFGTVSDVVPAMKYRLWIDLVSSVYDPPLTMSLPETTTTVFIGLNDQLGSGGEHISCSDHRLTKIPGHTAFRSFECMTRVLEVLRSCTTTETPFDALYTL